MQYYIKMSAVVLPPHLLDANIIKLFEYLLLVLPALQGKVCQQGSDGS